MRDGVSSHGNKQTYTYYFNGTLHGCGYARRSQRSPPPKAAAGYEKNERMLPWPRPGAAPPAAKVEASQADRWLDRVGLGQCKAEVRGAGITKVIDLANLDALEARRLWPKMPAKVRGQLFAKLEELDLDELSD